MSGCRDADEYGLPKGVAGYLAWEKAIDRDRILREMSATAGKGRGARVGRDIRYTARVIASFGQNGRGIFAGDDTVADVIGCGRKLVWEHRRTLVELRWFVQLGQHNRVRILSIALPVVEHIPAAPATAPEAEDPWGDDDYWAGRMREVEAARRSLDLAARASP